jgi:hypothetical protein
MHADFRALLDQANIKFPTRFAGELHQATGGGKSARPATDNHNIEFH